MSSMHQTPFFSTLSKTNDDELNQMGFFLYIKVFNAFESSHFIKMVFHSQLSQDLLYGYRGVTKSHLRIQ